MSVRKVGYADYKKNDADPDIVTVTVYYRWEETPSTPEYHTRRSKSGTTLAGVWHTSQTELRSGRMWTSFPDARPVTVTGREAISTK